MSVPDTERAPAATTRSRRLTAFIHIPKTAGTTLAYLLRLNQPVATMRIANVFKASGGVTIPAPYDHQIRRIARAPRARIVQGHMPFGFASHVPQNWEVDYLTLLREPVERAVSHYYQQVEMANRGTPRDPGDLNSDDGEELPPLTEAIPLKRAFTDLRYVPDNLQTRMLCGLPHPFGEVTKEMLERAKQNLQERFAVVGLVERFDESLVLLKLRLGYECILAGADRRVNTTRPRGPEIPSAVLEAAQRANGYDIKLYRHAQALFDRAPERERLDFQLELAALEHARTGALNEAPAAFPGESSPWQMVVEARSALLRSEVKRAKSRLAYVAHSTEVRGLKEQLKASEDRAERLEDQAARLNAKLSDRRLALSGRRETAASGDALRQRADELSRNEEATRARFAELQIRIADVEAGRLAQARVDGGDTSASPRADEELKELRRRARELKERLRKLGEQRAALEQKLASAESGP